MAERWEWVEIIEPRTKEHMYANLTTGECVWDLPQGVNFKRTDDNQWWELFDHNTSRFYYYNATSQKTVWHRPQNCDIIPLAKLQTLKQNTEVRDDEESRKPAKREISTQTPLTPLSRKRDHIRSDHIRSGSVRSTHSQGSPRFSRKHPPHRQGSTGGSGRFDRVDAYINGDRHHRRRGSQQSDRQVTYVRRDSVDLPQRSLESPLPRRARDSPRTSIDQGTTVSPASVRHELARTSFDQMPLSRQDSGRGSSDTTVSPVRQDSFNNREDCLRENLIYTGDMSPMAQQKPRARFPRTNPAYVPSHRPGQTSYKRINIDQAIAASSPAHESDEQKIHRYFDMVAPPTSQPMQTQTNMSLDSSSEFSDIRYRLDRSDSDRSGFRHERSDSDNRSRADRSDSESRLGYNTYKHERSDSDHSRGEGSRTSFDRHERIERSDSDLSHHSTRIQRHDHADSQSSHTSLTKIASDHSDSHSSQGSLRNVVDSQSSHGSLRNANEKVPEHSYDNEDILHQQMTHHQYPHPHHLNIKTQAVENVHDQVKVETPPVVLQFHQRQDSEPEYANLPIDQIPPPQVECSETVTQTSPEDDVNEFDSGEVLSGESLSPHEYASKHGTPGSERSTASQNSSFNSSGGVGEHAYDDSDASSVFSESSPKPKPRGGLLHLETQHASLKRKKPLEKSETVPMPPVLEKSQSLQAELAQQQRPLSMVVASQSEVNMVEPSTGSLQRQNKAGTIPSKSGGNSHGMGKKPSSESDIENYAQKHLNKHKKGLFGKKVPLNNMLSWSKDPIQKPMLRTNDKSVKKEAIDVFKLIQTYMGDRKGKTEKMGDPQVGLEISTKGWSIPGLRDEIFMQICRQTTENRNEESLKLGWELLAVCLLFYPPSAKFYNYLDGYIQKHLNLELSQETTGVPLSHYANICFRRLQRISKFGAKKGVRKPVLEEVEQAKKSIFHPSMFGDTLEDILLLQASRYPDRKLPWIQTTLSEEVLRLNGAQQEGIFRVPGDIDAVNDLKVRCDQWIPPTDCPDPHIPASLLKLWYRELYEPVIPPEFYEDCINNYANPDEAVAIVHRLPDINRLVLSYLIRFLQVFAAPENASITKMDVNNLAMVMAPNCLRCESEDPRVIFENTRKEMAFVRTLIQNLDTSFMEGII